MAAKQQLALVWKRIHSIPLVVQIAIGLNLQVDEAMARDLLQHVVEEPDTGGELRLARTIQIQAYGDLCLGRLARDFCGAWIVHGGEVCLFRHSGTAMPAPK